MQIIKKRKHVVRSQKRMSAFNWCNTINEIFFYVINYACVLFIRCCLRSVLRNNRRCRVRFQLILFLFSLSLLFCSGVRSPGTTGLTQSRGEFSPSLGRKKNSDGKTKREIQGRLMSEQKEQKEKNNWTPYVDKITKSAKANHRL